MTLAHHLVIILGNLANKLWLFAIPYG